MDQPDREAEQIFTQPVRQISIMLICLLLVGFGVYVAIPRIGPVFLLNIQLNGLIVLVFAVGVVACFYQVFELISSVSWIEGFVGRRVGQELGINCDLTFAYKFEYSASFESTGTEHELCWVYIGQTTHEPVINTTEIRDWRWMDTAELTAALSARADTFTPWLALEWQRLAAARPGDP